MNTAESIALTILIIAGYWLPSLVAWRRHVQGIGQVIIVNLLLGWTLIGWVVALVMAFRAVLPRAEVADSVTELDAAMAAFKAAADDDPRLDELAEAVKRAMRKRTAPLNWKAPHN